MVLKCSSQVRDGIPVRLPGPPRCAAFAGLANRMAAAILVAAALACAAPMEGSPGSETRNLVPGPDSTDRDIVVMKEFIVEGAHADWKYLACPGYEILARCDKNALWWYSEGFFRSFILQEELLPEGCLRRPAVPVTAILYEQKPPPQGARDQVVPKPVEIAPDRGRFWGEVQVGSMRGGILARDWDTASVAENLWDVWRFINPARPLMFCDGGFLSFRLRRVCPEPPLWFLIGLIQPLGLSNLAPQETYILLPGSAWILRLRALADRDAAARAAQQRAERAARSPAAGVVSLEPLVVEGKSSIALLPMSEVFREINPEDGPPTILWAMESALFVRWGYSQIRGEPDHRADFTRFVYRASREPVSEPVFRECFGFGYTEIQSRLARFLDTAVENLATLKYKRIERWPPELPPVTKRAATEVEIARIIGDWERMRGLELKDRRPDLGRMYLEQAGKTLLRPYQDGERDPRLLAVIGLYKHDIGEDAASRELLEEAVGARVGRPAAYRYLAWLRFADARAHAEAGGEKLSPRQVADILAPIFSVREMDPLPVSTYQFVAEVWAKVPPDPRPWTWRSSTKE